MSSNRTCLTLLENRLFLFFWTAEEEFLLYVTTFLEWHNWHHLDLVQGVLSDYRSYSKNRSFQKPLTQLWFGSITNCCCGLIAIGLSPAFPILFIEDCLETIKFFIIRNEEIFQSEQFHGAALIKVRILVIWKQIKTKMVSFKPPA